MAKITLEESLKIIQNCITSMENWEDHCGWIPSYARITLNEAKEAIKEVDE
jgi:hypothetical protein